MADEPQQGQVVRSGRDLLPLVRDAENSGDEAISQKGATGRYQIMPGTARHYGFDPMQLKDPAYNEKAATAILDDLNRRYRGDVDAIMVAYNAGPTVANRWLKSGKTQGLPAETLKYLDRAQQFVKVNGKPLDLPEQKVAADQPPYEPATAAPVADGQRALQKLQAGGFTSDDMASYKSQQTQTLLKGGFTPQEIDSYWGESDPSGKPLEAPMMKNFTSVPQDDAPKIAKNPVEAFAAGWDMSVSGLGIRNKMPDTFLGEDASLTQKISAGVGQMAGDLPFNVAGGIIGAGGGAAVGAEAGPGAALTATVGMGAGALMLPQAMRETMMDYYRRGEIHSFKDFAKMSGVSVWNTMKAGLTGALMGPVGGAAKSVVAPIAGEALGEVANLTTQAFTATAVSSALDGHVPDDEDFLAGAALMIGVKAGTWAGGRFTPSKATQKVADTMQDIYRKTGVPPWKATEQARTDPVFRQELLAEDPSGEPVYPKTRANAADEPPPFTSKEVTIHEPAEGEGPPKEPPVEDDVTSPAPGPKKVEGPEPLPEDILNEMANEFIGVPPRPDSDLNPAKLYRQWVSELGPARAIDKMLTKQGFDTKTQLGIEDMFRQTYASDTRAGYFVLHGSIDPITLDHRSNVPSLMDAVRAVKQNGGNLNDWINYMVAKRAQEKAAQGFETGHPLTPEQLDQLVAHGKGKYQDASEMAQVTMDAGLEYGRDSGVFSQDQIVNMKLMNQMYISYRRLMGDDAAMKQSKPGKRGFRVSEPVRQFEGDDRQITDPMLATIDNLHQIIRMSDRNRAIGSVITLAERNGLTELLGLKQIKAPEIKATIAEPGSDVFKPYLPENVSTEPYKPFLAVRAMRKNFTANDNRFLYIRNGVPEVWQAASPELAALFRGADSLGEANLALQIAGKVASLQRTGIVTSPDFPIRNVTRDQLTAFIMDPSSPPPFITWVRGAMEAFGQGEGYLDWVRKGGAGTALVEMDKDVLARDMQKIFEDTGIWGKMWNVVRHPIEAMQILSERIDAASRIGFKQAAESDGIQPVKAATMGRKAYLDFAEKGTLAFMQWWSRSTPFLRPGVLGLKQFAEGVKADPLGVVFKSIMAVTLPTVILYGLNWMQDEYGDLPEEQKFKNLPRWQKDIMYVLPSVGGVRVRIPYPFIVGPTFGGMTTRFLDKMVQDDPAAFKQWWQTAVAQLFPSIIPAVVLPVLETVTNHNFFSGHALVPDNLKDASGDMQYTDNTTEAAKALARWVKPMGVDMSPIMFEDFVRNWSGSVGMAALKAMSAPFKEEGKPWEAADLPFVGSFLVRHPGMTAQPIQDFFDASSEMQTILEDRSLARKRLAQGVSGAEGEFNDAMDQQALKLQRVENALHMMKGNVVAVNNDKTMTVDEKRQFTDDLYGNMIETAKMGSQMIDQMKASK